jgi:hypothetical protein
MNKKSLLNLFSWLAIFGNVIFIFWIIYNGLDEGFSAAPVQIASYLGLTLLLLLNTIIIWRKHL